MTTVEDIEREIGWDLTPEIETTYKTKPVLIAQDAKFRMGNNAGVNNNAANNVNTSETADANNDKTVVNPPEQNDTEIVNFADFERAVDRKAYVGKRVRLEAVNVESVAGDRAFFVGTNPAKRILVVFDQEKTPNTPVEGKVDIDRGQRVTIDGVIRAMPATIEEAKRQFGGLRLVEDLNSLIREETYIWTDDPKIAKGKTE